MHQFHKGLEKRLAALERLIGSVAVPETPDQRARRLVLVHAAFVGETPADLTPEERPVFSKILRYAPIALELRYEGIIGPDGEPAGGDDHPKHDDGDGDGQELVWVP